MTPQTTQSIAVTAMMIVVTPAPRTNTKAISRTSTGKAMITSIALTTTVSIQPPR